MYMHVVMSRVHVAGFHGMANHSLEGKSLFIYLAEESSNYVKLISMDRPTAW